MEHKFEYFFVNTDDDIVYCDLTGRIATDEDDCKAFVEVVFYGQYRWVRSDDVFAIRGERI